MWAQYPIGIQVRGELDEEVRQVSLAIDIEKITRVERADYGHRLQALAYCVRIDGSVSYGQNQKQGKAHATYKTTKRSARPIRFAGKSAEVLGTHDHRG
jgi:hypothetical protein